MYEVTYSIEGIIKKINIPANDSIQVQSSFQNMFGGTKAEIINIRRI